MRRGIIEGTSSISEVGILGYYISENEKMLVNEVGGYLLRTKVNINFNKIMLVISKQ